jgi:hypothetical protein
MASTPVEAPRPAEPPVVTKSRLERVSESASKLKAKVIPAAKADVYEPYLNALKTYFETTKWKPSAENKQALMDALEGSMPPATVARRLKNINAERTALINAVDELKPLAAYTQEQRLWLFKAVFERFEAQVGLIAKGGEAQAKLIAAKEKPILNAAREIVDDILSKTSADGVQGVFRTMIGLRVTGAISEEMLHSFSMKMGTLAAAELTSVFGSQVGATAEIKGKNLVDDFHTKLLRSDLKPDVIINDYINRLSIETRPEIKKVLDELKAALLTRPTEAEEISNVKRIVEKLTTERGGKRYRNEIYDMVEGYVNNSILPAAKKTHKQLDMAAYNAAVEKMISDKLAVPGSIKALKASLEKAKIAVASELLDKPTLETLVTYVRNFEVELAAAKRVLKNFSQKSEWKAAQELFGTKGWKEWLAKDNLEIFGIGKSVLGKLGGMGKWFVEHPGGTKWLLGTGALIGGGVYGYSRYRKTKAEELETRVRSNLAQQKKQQVADAIAQKKAKELEEANKRTQVSSGAKTYLTKISEGGLTVIPINSERLTADQKNYLLGNLGAWIELEKELRAQKFARPKEEETDKMDTLGAIITKAIVSKAWAAYLNIWDYSEVMKELSEAVTKEGRIKREIKINEIKGEQASSLSMPALPSMNPSQMRSQAVADLGLVAPKPEKKAKKKKPSGGGDNPFGVQ